MIRAMPSSSGVRTCDSLARHGFTRMEHAPGLAKLVGDVLRRTHGISPEAGHSINSNKNPIAERAIEDLGMEIIRVNSQVILCVKYVFWHCFYKHERNDQTRRTVLTWNVDTQ